LSLLGQAVTIPRDPAFQLEMNDRVDCMIRPEFWRVDSEGNFKGTVLKAVYLGPYIEYEISLGGQTVSLVDFHHHLHQPKSEGDPIQLVLTGSRKGI
jgi:iron(III) transport system ATP-binding protein